MTITNSTRDSFLKGPFYIKDYGHSGCNLLYFEENDVKDDNFPTVLPNPSNLKWTNKLIDQKGFYRYFYPMIPKNTPIMIYDNKTESLQQGIVRKVYSKHIAKKNQ